MMGEVGKPLTLQLQWHQFVAFVLGVLFSYFLTVLYRKRHVPQEYHRVFFFAMAVAYPFIFFASWLLNMIVIAYLGIGDLGMSYPGLGFNVIVSFVYLIILITLLSILFGRLGVCLAKVMKKFKKT